MAHTGSQEKDYLKELLECESRIIGILKQLEEIEKTKGIDSPEYKSMCGLFQDFLAEEEQAVSMSLGDIVQTAYVLKCLRSKEILKADEALYALNFTIDNSPLYRIYRLLLERNVRSGAFDSDFAIKDNIDESIDIEVLKDCSDIELKYRLAFVNPRLSIDMACSNFNPGMVVPDAEAAVLMDDQFYDFKKNHYLRKRFSEIIGFIAENEIPNIDIYYRFLLAVKKRMPVEFIPDELRLLVSQGIPFEKANNAYTTLLRKEKEENQRKNLTNE